MQPRVRLNREYRKKGEKHYISNCPIAEKETKPALLEEYQRAKRVRIGKARKKERKVGRVAKTTSSRHSSFFES